MCLFDFIVCFLSIQRGFMSAILCALNPSTTNYDNTGYGGKPELTRTEIAGLLKGLDQAAFNFAMAKYCFDWDAFRLLQFHCIQKSGEFAVKYGWKVQRGKPVIMSLGALAVIESVNERLCFACNSPLMLGKKKCSCDALRSKMLHVDRSEYVGVCESKWRQTWRDRYEQLFVYCQLFDGEVNRCVSANLKKVFD